METKNRTLQQWFDFYCEVNSAPLAYFFARQKFVGYRGADYNVPEFLVLA